MANKNLDAKHEKILKALLRLPENKRCAVCDTLGPQYVVVNFNTFVCTICSGVHRQFSHRCKGVSMATFKPEEIRALEEGGNGAALASYLAKWTPRDAPKPVDRNVAKIRDWIDLVFVKKRYYSKDAAYLPPVSRTQSTSSARSTASRENDVTFKIPAGVPSNGPTTPQGYSETVRTTSEAGSLIDLELFSPTPAARAASAPSAPAPQAAQQASAHSGWDTFGETGGGAPAVVHAAPAAPQEEVQGWSTFEQPGVSTPAPAGGADSSAVGGFHGWQAFESTGPSTPPVPSPSEGPHSKGPVMKELPSDLFSEPVAPAPKAQHLVPGALQYGHSGEQIGQANMPVHPGFAPGMIAYPLQAGPVPPGYLSVDQQYFLPSPGVVPSPAQHPQSALGSGSSPAAVPTRHAAPPEDDIFSSLVPGLRSTLPAVPPPPAAVAASFNGGFLPQHVPAQQPAPYALYGAQQFGQPAAAQSNGTYGVPHSSPAGFYQGAVQQPGVQVPGSFDGFGAPPESKPKRAGGNPFA
ncbi:g10372 [Coccomyxa elongata]